MRIECSTVGNLPCFEESSGTISRIVQVIDNCPTGQFCLLIGSAAAVASLFFVGACAHNTRKNTTLRQFCYAAGTSICFATLTAINTKVLGLLRYV